jgi:hypothetical protein
MGCDTTRGAPKTPCSSDRLAHREAGIVLVLTAAIRLPFNYEVDQFGRIHQSAVVK